MTLPDIDTEKVAQIIRGVAETEVMPRFRNLAAGEIREKNPGDFVTVADEASEKALGAALSALLPGSLVVGEEAVSKNPAVLDRFGEDAPVWVIDPIDGTYNFAHGRSHFGILVALVQGGVTRYGWVFDAPGNRMAIAVKGGGATIDGRTARMRKDAQTPLEMSGMGGGAQAWHFAPVNGVVKEVRNVRSSLHDFLTLAAGEADFVVHVSSVTPWDHAPTILLAEEAGAFVRVAGEEDRPVSPAVLRRKTMLIAAADPARWKMLETLFYPKLLR
jgi:fructose-1,6-bisphosphatase/inositol monophosphatase family enzyme